MAYKKKTESVTEFAQTETEKSETEKNTTNVIVEKPKRTFTDSDYILCRSVWYGGLNVTCKSGNSYEFKDYGRECDINYRDLVSLIRKSSDHIFLPRFIILDEDFLNEFPNVKKVYTTLYTTSDLLDILNLPTSKMKSEIMKLPEESKDVLCKIVATEIANGHLDSISKVRTLSEIFDSDFNLLSELFVR